MLGKIALGAELDFASAGELDAGIDRVLDFMGKQDKPLPTFNVMPVSKSITVGPATNTLIVDAGSPPVGRAWNILGFALSSSDDFTQSSAGTVGFYIGAVPASGAPSLAQLRIPRLVVPASQSFTVGTHWCFSNDNVIFNLVGLVIAATQFVANVFVAEWRECDVVDSLTR